MKKYPYINNNDDLIIISGATATGKSKCAINLAKALDGEVISCDSMQIYRKMDIGTAKVTKEEMDGVPHHLIDIIEPTDDFSVAEFQQIVYAAINDIRSRGKTPILCGGTGFYTNAIIYNTEFTESEKDEEYRLELQKLADEKGSSYVHNILKTVDEQASKDIHHNNLKKVIRALEYNKLTGLKISEHNEEEKKRKPFFNAKHFLLDIDRKVLYDRIDKRVDIMIDAGLIEEFYKLIEMGCTRELNSMKAIGYAELFEYLDGTITKQDAIDLIKKNSRNYAKRQLTWFRNKSEAIFINVLQFSENDLTEYIIKLAYKNER